MLDPKDFSYNSSQGWCPRCRGFGELFHIPDVERGANADAVEESWWRWSEGQRETCPECLGGRLRPEPRAVRLRMPLEGTGTTCGPVGAEPTIDDFAAATVEDALAWAERVRPQGRDAEVARDIVPEVRDPNMFRGMKVFDISMLDQTPVPKFQARPQYPFEMRRAGIAGEVVVDFIVDTNGDVQNAYALRSSQREFEAAAVAAVSKWKFKPGRKGGRDVPTHMQVPIVFTLNEE